MKRMIVVSLLILALLGCSKKPADNSILVLNPYQHASTWVFDDPTRGLEKEPFVAGIPGIIDRVVDEIPDADKGFRLLFSAQSFPGYTHTLVWQRKGSGGNWYRCPQLEMEGWLCPALYKYFRRAPETIYFKAEETSILPTQRQD